MGEKTTDSARRRGPRVAWHPVLWWAGWVLVALLVAAEYTGAVAYGFLFHVGPLLVQARLVAVALYVLVLVCWSCSLRMRTPRAPTNGRLQRFLVVMRKVAAALMATVIVLLGGLYTLLTGLFLLSEHYHMLHPASPGGCRVVVSVTQDAEYGSDGLFYLALPGSIVVRETGYGWSMPGSIDPFRHRDWSLRWDRRTAHLTVNGENYDDRPPHGPYRSSTGTFDCPR